MLASGEVKPEVGGHPGQGVPPLALQIERRPHNQGRHGQEDPLSLIHI